jgi:uncharacterized protein (TIGR02391 family)
MNLESKIEERLWKMIQNSYEDRNYTGAIHDAIYFLSDLIREKSGLASDGVSLVGQAFGGKSPKLKINKLQSESDKNIQAGIAQILRGIYQAIRNPRSHEKYNDSISDADSIILFINYLTKIIDRSKTPFTKRDFIERVFEEHFVPKKRYADLLVNEIPKKQRLDIFIEVYRLKEQGNGEKLKYFFDSLIEKLNKDELNEVYDTISDELKTTDNDDTIKMILQIFPPNFILNYDEISRLRLENKLIESIKTGRYIPNSHKCLRGALGTWVANRCEYFILKNDLISVLLNKLSSSDDQNQDYVFNYFFGTLQKLVNPPSGRIVNIINNGLKSGNEKFYGALLFTDEDWMKPFKEAYDNFQETEPVCDDKVPF